MTRPDQIFLALFSLTLISMLVITEVVRRRTPIPAEWTRKTVHILAGVCVAFTPFVLDSMWPMVVIGSVFAVFNFFAIRFHLLPGLHNTGRQSWGTFYYPISFVLLTLLLWESHRVILVTAMLIMAIADALAAIIGKRFGHQRVLHNGLESKSLIGSLTLGVTSFGIVMFTFSVFKTTAGLSLIWMAGVVAVLAVALESVSLRGSDNLTLPLGSAFVMHYMVTQSSADNLIFTLGIVLSALVGWMSFRARFLDASGTVGLFILGSLIFGVGRWTFSLPILTFFILSSLLSKAGKRRKQQVDGVFEKTSRRDIWQVLANGGIPGLILLLWYLYPSDILFLLYVGALAAVTADTWGTEVGVLSTQSPRSILTGKKVPLGASGGITLLGSVGALMGAMVVAAVAWLVSPHDSPRLMGGLEFMLLTGAGFIASMVDSVLGATLQVQYQCPLCGKQTEKRHHCQDVETSWIRGVSWMGNDWVNSLAALSGMGFVLIGWFWLTG